MKTMIMTALLRSNDYNTRACSHAATRLVMHDQVQFTRCVVL